jgi:hypothetical protein
MYTLNLVPFIHLSSKVGFRIPCNFIGFYSIGFIALADGMLYRHCISDVYSEIAKNNLRHS